MGNCVDKFLEKKIIDNINLILEIERGIESREPIRKNVVDYFSHPCYEYDFTDIRKTKETALKIVTECDKFLERISLQYSKFN